MVSFLIVYNNDFLRNKTGRWIAKSSVIDPDNSKTSKIREHSKISVNDLKKFEEGDIILRRGFGRISDLIEKEFKEKYGVTHCGVLTLRDSVWYVINSESNNLHEGMQMTGLRQFLIDSHPKTIMVVRLNQEKHRPDFIKWMNNYLERKVQFDYKFDDTDTTELYCTEVIDLSLQKALGEKILTDRIKIGLIDGPKFRHFYNPEYVEIIINQFEEVD